MLCYQKLNQSVLKRPQFNFQIFGPGLFYPLRVIAMVQIFFGTQKLVGLIRNSLQTSVREMGGGLHSNFIVIAISFLGAKKSMVLQNCQTKFEP